MIGMVCCLCMYEAYAEVYDAYAKSFEIKKLWQNYSVVHFKLVCHCWQRVIYAVTINRHILGTFSWALWCPKWIEEDRKKAFKFSLKMFFRPWIDAVQNFRDCLLWLVRFSNRALFVILKKWIENEFRCSVMNDKDFLDDSESYMIKIPSSIVNVQRINYCVCF